MSCSQDYFWEKKLHRPFIFLAYVLALGLGLFVAQKRLAFLGNAGDAGDAINGRNTVFFVMLTMVFCIHFALHQLWKLRAYLAEGASSPSNQHPENTGLPIRRTTVSILACAAIILASSEWLMMQSTHPWLSFVLFASITAAMFMLMPQLSERLSAASLFLHLHICVALFGTSYAVMSHDFAPYYLALTIPVMLLVASVAHHQYIMTSTKGRSHFLWQIPCKPLMWPLVSAVLLCLIMNYVPTVPLGRTMLATGVQKTTLEQHSSMSIQASSQDAMERGVVYGFGVKDSSTGSIDCSGWIAEMNQKMMRSMNARMGKEVYGEKAKLALLIGANGGAAGLVLAVKVVTGEELRNDDLTPDKVRAGLTIGLDTGEKSWDGGRYAGIDHIVQTYADPETGIMMVSQSSGGVGVHVMPYADWYAKWGHEAKLYGVDMSLLANSAPVPSL